MRTLSQRRDEPVFLTERRGGWDEWDDVRIEITGIGLPNGTDLEFGDEVLVDAEAAGIDVEPDEFIVDIEFGNWIDFQEVKLESWRPNFETRLSESEFQDAWGDWVSLPNGD